MRFFNRYKITHGVDWEISEKDYLISSSELPDITQQDDIIFEYNQGKYKQTKNSCTVVSSIWAVSDLFNYEFTDKEILEIDSATYKKDRTKWKWRWLFKAVDHVRESWNAKFPNKEIVSYRLKIENNSLIEALNKWHTIVTTYAGTYAYNRDFRKDWVLNWTVFPASEVVYRHAVCIRKIDWRVFVKNSYKWSKYNIYELVDRRELIKNWVFSIHQYLFLPIKKIKKTKEEIKFEQRLKQLLSINSSLWKQADLLWWHWEIKKALHNINKLIRKTIRE